MNTIIEQMNWRYATKAFDENKKVSQEDLATIVEAFRLTASSFGLQPWKLVVVEDEATKKSLVEHSWGQQQIANCSHLLVLCRKDNFDEKNVDEFLDDMVQTRGVSRQDLAGYEGMMKGFIANLDEDTKRVWIDKQIYIALGNLMTVCAQMKIDTCAVEGFLPEKYDEVLSLKEKGISSVVVLPIGYRSSEDTYSQLPKVRFSQEDILEKI